MHNKMCESFALRYEQFIESIKIKAVKYEISPTEATNENEADATKERKEKRDDVCLCLYASIYARVLVRSSF